MGFFFDGKELWDESELLALEAGTVIDVSMTRRSLQTAQWLHQIQSGQRTWELLRLDPAASGIMRWLRLSCPRMVLLCVGPLGTCRLTVRSSCLPCRIVDKLCSSRLQNVRQITRSCWPLYLKMEML